MSQLDDALEGLQAALDDEDIEAICVAAAIILAICRIVSPGSIRGGTAAGVAVDDPEGDALFDPDELGFDPEDFDVNFWRKKSATG